MPFAIKIKMQTKFKRHQYVILLKNPDPEYIEYAEESEKPKEIPIKKGMKAKINILLPNGRYHVEVLGENGEVIAYCPMDEEDLSALED